MKSAVVSESTNVVSEPTKRATPRTIRPRSVISIQIGLLLIAQAVAAQQPTRVGSEFRVNSNTINFQGYPKVASSPSGSFVVTWEQFESGDSSISVFAQRYAADGTKLATEFQVNTYTSYAQTYPSIASDEAGNFVIVWAGDDYGFGVGAGVYGQRFSSAGTPLGVEFLVNSYSTSTQTLPSVASDLVGNFTVVWQGVGPFGDDGSGNGIFMKRFNSDGTFGAGELLVNSTTANDQTRPAVATDGLGNLVVAWASNGQDGSSIGIFGQRFAANGSEQGPEFQVNTYTTNSQSYPGLAADGSGNFVIAWPTDRSDGSFTSVAARQFAAGGAAMGAEFQVNSSTPNRQSYRQAPAVASFPSGDFVIIWEDHDLFFGTILAQHYDPNGAMVGAEFQVNSYTSNQQTHPAVAQDSAGNFVVVWQSNAQEGSPFSYGVFAQRYRIVLSPMFEDGFESGGVTGWSSSVP